MCIRDSIYDDGRLFLDFSEQTASLNGKQMCIRDRVSCSSFIFDSSLSRTITLPEVGAVSYTHLSPGQDIFPAHGAAA